MSLCDDDDDDLDELLYNISDILSQVEGYLETDYQVAAYNYLEEYLESSGGSMQGEDGHRLLNLCIAILGDVS